MGSTNVGAFLPEDRNRTTFQNAVNLKILKDGFSPKKKTVSDKFSHTVFSHLSAHDGRLCRVQFTVKRFYAVWFRVSYVKGKMTSPI
jgi:hypothetical protein